MTKMKPLQLVAAAATVALASAQCSFSNVYGDHMVLQRESQDTVVHGFGKPGDQVVVALNGQTLPSTAVGADGIWRTKLPSTPAGGPYTVTATCAAGGSASLQDVMFGDVFLCG